jgi:hypothetical protein
MNQLLSYPVYGERDDSLFIEQMNNITLHHLKGCPEFARIYPKWSKAKSISDIPFVHVGLFKHLDLKTRGEFIKHERVVHSSATSGKSSLISTDEYSSKLQSESIIKILTSFLGEGKRPLLILDSVKSLYNREVSARVAAAMILRPLASDIQFLLENADDPKSLKWSTVEEVLDSNDEIIIYGFSWILWLAWANQSIPANIKKQLSDKKIHFVHSGGWKKLEEIKVNHSTFNAKLLKGMDKASQVIDFYGLVEQLGIIYPLCQYGARHVPVWADVIVRDSYTLKPLYEGEGQLQLLNTLAYGAPYHSVLTEDLGRLLNGTCECGRKGRRFQLVNRIPKAELRGCANV